MEAKDWTWVAAIPAGVELGDDLAPFENRLGRAAKYSSMLMEGKEKEKGRTTEEGRDGREGRRKEE